MFAEMLNWMLANKAFEQKLLGDFFEGMAKQISAAHPSWQSVRNVLRDGTIAFIGRDAANIFAVKTNGEMRQSDPAKGALRFDPATGEFELDYQAMRVIE